MASTFFVLLVFQGFINTSDSPTFEAQVIDSHVSIGYGLAIGDVDGDRKPDILMADKKQFVWYRNGDWKKFVMVENLTESDNVCIAARDIDGDGKVEVAVGAQWNPSETSDPLKSGSVHYLIRPNDPTQLWTPVALHHEPTIHRMRWVKAADKKYHLIVLPLHGRGNKNGEGAGVKVFAYERPADPKTTWKQWVIDESMHLTHNMDVLDIGKSERLYIGGKEGIKIFSYVNGSWSSPGPDWFVQGQSFGEVRVSKGKGESIRMTGIEPMHGTHLTVYDSKNTSTRTVLTPGLNQGHALGVSDLLNLGNNQVVVGWREPDADKKVGIKIYVPQNPDGTSWKDYWVDDNGMACEDLQLADLDGDGRKDIIAAGRSSHNLKIYWNKSK